MDIEQLKLIFSMVKELSNGAQTVAIAYFVLELLKALMWFFGVIVVFKAVSNFILKFNEPKAKPPEEYELEDLTMAKHDALLIKSALASFAVRRDANYSLGSYKYVHRDDAQAIVKVLNDTVFERKK